MKKPQKNLKADTSTPVRHGKCQPIINIAGLDHSPEQKYNPMEAYEESVTDNLRLVCDVLRDPPYSQLHTDDYSQYKEPKAGEGLDDILDNHDAIVVQLYRNRGQSGVVRRYRSVKEIIYGEGPTDVMKGAMRDLEAMRSKGLLPKDHVMNDGEEPRFMWIHLPATNVSDDLEDRFVILANWDADCMDEGNYNKSCISVESRGANGANRTSLKELRLSTDAVRKSTMN